MWPNVKDSCHAKTKMVLGLYSHRNDNWYSFAGASPFCSFKNIKHAMPAKLGHSVQRSHPTLVLNIITGPIISQQFDQLTMSPRTRHMQCCLSSWLKQGRLILQEIFRKTWRSFFVENKFTLVIASITTNLSIFKSASITAVEPWIAAMWAQLKPFLFVVARTSTSFLHNDRNNLTTDEWLF